MSRFQHFQHFNISRFQHFKICFTRHFSTFQDSRFGRYTLSNVDKVDNMFWLHLKCWILKFADSWKVEMLKCWNCWNVDKVRNVNIVKVEMLTRLKCSIISRLKCWQGWEFQQFQCWNVENVEILKGLTLAKGPEPPGLALRDTEGRCIITWDPGPRPWHWPICGLAAAPNQGLDAPSIVFGFYQWIKLFHQSGQASLGNSIDSTIPFLLLCGRSGIAVFGPGY